LTQIIYVLDLLEINFLFSFAPFASFAVKNKIMTVTIELKPEIEKRLAEKAKKNGLPIETFIEVFIEDSLEAVEEKEKPFHETATKEEWLAEFRKWIDSHKDKDYPVLPDEAYSRETIYEDRF